MAIVSTGAVAPPLRLSRSVVYVAIFALVAAYFLIFPIWRAQFPLEIWLTEGFNAYWQDAAIGGKLYPSAESLTGNNYPPLSFFAVGALGALLGDNLYVGRALSIVGLLCVGGEIFLCCRILTGNAWGAAIGALWYVAIMAHNSVVYVGANDPQIAGEAIMGAGLAWFLVLDRARLSTTPALLVMVIGGFWKHNMIAIPLTAVVWLTIHRRGYWSILLSAVATVAGLVVCRLLFGQEFFRNLLMSRAYRLGGVLANIGHLQWCAPALAIWAAWATTNRGRVPAQFTMLHVSAGLASCLIQWTGDGVSGNAEFDLLLALGIGIGAALKGLRPSYGTAAIAVLLVRLLATDRQESALVLFGSDFRSYYSSGTRAFRAEVAKVAAIPGDVFCTNKLVCRLAGKRFIVDDFKTEQMAATGKMTAEEVAMVIAEAGVTVVQNSDATRSAPETSLRRIMFGR